MTKAGVSGRPSPQHRPCSRGARQDRGPPDGAGIPWREGSGAGMEGINVLLLRGRRVISVPRRATRRPAWNARCGDARTERPAPVWAEARCAPWAGVPTAFTRRAQRVPRARKSEARGLMSKHIKTRRRKAQMEGDTSGGAAARRDASTCLFTPPPVRAWYHTVNGWRWRKRKDETACPYSAGWRCSRAVRPRTRRCQPAAMDSRSPGRTRGARGRTSARGPARSRSRR